MITLTVLLGERYYFTFALCRRKSACLSSAHEWRWRLPQKGQMLRF